MFFGIFLVAYRAASLALGGPSFMMQVAVKLAVVIVFQTVITLIWILLKERDELLRIAKAWRFALFTGLVRLGHGHDLAARNDNQVAGPDRDDAHLEARD